MSLVKFVLVIVFVMRKPEIDELGRDYGPLPPLLVEKRKDKEGRVAAHHSVRNCMYWLLASLRNYALPVELARKEARFFPSLVGLGSLLTQLLELELQLIDCFLQLAFRL